MKTKKKLFRFRFQPTGNETTKHIFRVESSRPVCVHSEVRIPITYEPPDKPEGHRWRGIRPSPCDQR